MQSPPGAARVAPVVHSACMFSSRFSANCRLHSSKRVRRASLQRLRPIVEVQGHFFFCNGTAKVNRPSFVAAPPAYLSALL